ncbi:MAG: hypothetical protein JSU83_22515 [Deltaproteobacteria bacterium]|nr:MAG: hypothetical protein JSU83_22515 [Deltaproteobacteria bacterium]
MALLFCHLEISTQKNIQSIGGTEISDYFDYIVKAENEHQYHETVAFFDAIDLECIPAVLPSLTVFINACEKRELPARLSTEEIYPGATLTSNRDQFLAAMKKKDRHEIRRKIQQASTARRKLQNN